MKLATFFDGREKLGVMVSDTELADLSTDDRISNMDMIAALAAGEEFLVYAGSVLRDAPRVAVGDVRLMAPVPRPRKILAIGLNYLDHIEEAVKLGINVPDVPLVFTKAVTSVCGPYDDVHLPRVSEKLDYEAEFGIVIGRRCRHVRAEHAAHVIAGFICVNDVSVRDWQMATGQFFIGKSFDTHCPMGPALLTIDEVGAEPDLSIRLWVNGDLRQDDSTLKLKFSCGALLEHLSRAMTLEPGDIIATGTPGGVGFAMKPPRWLRQGDVVKLEVEKIGTLVNRIVEEPEGHLSAATSTLG